MTLFTEDHLASYFYYDKHVESEAAKVLPGEYYVTNRDIAIMTVLGSCVSACIRDREAGIGGLNHFMLPSNGDLNNPVSPSMRYGTYAMEVLINRLLKEGARRERLEAKVFGGGLVMRAFSGSENNVGARNAAFVIDYLKTEKITVLAKDLNDIYPRKVYFFPVTGKVLVKKLRQPDNKMVSARERDYQTQLKTTPITGVIDLF